MNKNIRYQKLKAGEQRWQMNNIPRKENQNDTLKEKHDIRNRNTNMMFALFTCTFRFEMLYVCFLQLRCILSCSAEIL